MDEGHLQRSRQQEVKPRPAWLLLPLAHSLTSSPTPREEALAASVPMGSQHGSLGRWLWAPTASIPHPPILAQPLLQLPDAPRCAISQMGLQRGSSLPT